MATINHDFKIIDPSTGLGLEMASMTVVVRNRDNAAVQTFGPWAGGVLPSWLQIVSMGDIVYRFISGTLDDALLPPDFAFLVVSGTTSLYGTEISQTTIATLAADSVPTLPDGLEPYADIAYADAYFNRRLGAFDWFGLPEAIKLRALVTAADDLDSEVYKGVKLDYFTAPGALIPATRASQRQWPRIIPEYSYIWYTDGEDPSSYIPNDIKDANCEQAAFLVRALYANREDPNDRRDIQLAGLSGFQGQGAAETWLHERMPNDRICAAARDRIRPYLLVAAPLGFGF